jgi:fucose permease
MATSVKWSYLILAYCALFALGIIDNARGPAYPDILGQMQLSATEGSLIFALASLSGLLLNLTSRWWLAPIGVVRSVFIAMLIMGIGSIGMGMAPQFSSPKLWLFLASFIAGFGLSGSTISMNVLVSRAVPTHLRRRALAGLHSTYGLSSLVAPLCLAAFYRYQPAKWDTFFILLAIVPFGLFIINLFLKPETLPLTSSRGALIAPVSFIKRAPYGMMLASYVTAEIVVSSRLVLFLQSFYAVDPESAKLSLAAFFGLFTFGRLFFSLVTLKGQSFHYLIFSLVSTLALFALGHFWPMLLPLTGLSMSFFFPFAVDWINSHFEHGQEFMTASALTFVGVFLVLMHALFGIISDMIGILWAFAIAPMGCILALILLIIIETKMPRMAAQKNS